MNYITNIHNSEITKLQVAKEYATRFQNDFVMIKVDNHFTMIRATRYIGMSFLNKVRKLSENRCNVPIIL